MRRKQKSPKSDSLAVVTPPTNGKPPERSESIVKYVLDQQTFRTQQDLLKLRIAVDDAENVQSYNRELLHDIYRDIVLDPNLSSQWNSRKMKTKEKPFKVVNAEGDEDKDLTEVLEQPWFFDFIDAALDSMQWGFTLIEFGQFDKARGRFLPYQVESPEYKSYKQYPAINVIERDHVKPEFGLVVHLAGDITGISIYDPRYADYLMMIGKPCDYGWLSSAAKYILFKNNCLGNWSEWAEVFGMDVRIGKTDSQGNDRTAFMKAIRDIGSNAYGVFKTNDEIEFAGTSRTDAYGVYKELINYIDEQSSKLIFGQDVVNNNVGRVVGTVGENVADMYGASDARFIQAIVNDRLFPLMEKLGYPWGDSKFMFDNTEKLTMAEKIVIDEKLGLMGYEHPVDYINSTYGVEVEKKEIPEPLKEIPGGAPRKQLPPITEK
jgi:phage gp29-like protein